MTLTDKARRDFEEYLEEVRASLADDPDVDADDVVEGIREHVEAALSGRGADPGTAEDLADVLERLGSPDRWGDSEASGSPEAARRPGDHPESSRRHVTEVTPLVLASAGMALILAELTVPLGWGLVVAGAVTARVALGVPGVGIRRDAPLTILVSLLWHLAAAAAAGAFLLLPAALVWGQSQIGGVLEPFVFGRTLPPGASPVPAERPDGYWPLVGLLAGTATGGWWIVAGFLIRSTGERIRKVLGPASYLASAAVGRSLLLGGGLLFVSSVLLLVGAMQ